MKNLFRRLLASNSKDPVNPYCPAGSRTYCIGDIHGRDDLLEQVHEQILGDASNHSGTNTIIYLGDYIDRGMHSKQVIELLLASPLPGFDSIYLRGNHEQSLLDFLMDAKVGHGWFNYGGLQTLVSYGIRYRKIPSSIKDMQALQGELKERLPYSHINFFEKTCFHHSIGNYYFVHAGVNPRFSLEQQQPEDQLWIREDFIKHTKPFEKIIVYGHTITDEPDFQHNRIGLDTGAYQSGKLSCLVLENDTQRIIQTHA
ncbi:MAG: serine/threonine protein phosphatase 1 [Saprospiraceae bacterium]|jgi:serine/threonine protein phosphatase 1